MQYRGKVQEEELTPAAQPANEGRNTGGQRVQGETSTGSPCHFLRAKIKGLRSPPFNEWKPMPLSLRLSLRAVPSSLLFP